MIGLNSHVPAFGYELTLGNPLVQEASPTHHCRVLMEILSGSFLQSFLAPSGFCVMARDEGPTQAVL